MNQQERQVLKQIIARLDAIAAQAPRVANYIKGAADLGYAPKVRDVVQDLRKLVETGEAEEVKA